jgi:thiol-disulfide isomerase/thioredoxin
MSLRITFLLTIGLLLLVACDGSEPATQAETANESAQRTVEVPAADTGVERDAMSDDSGEMTNDSAAMEGNSAAMDDPATPADAGEFAMGDESAVNTDLPAWQQTTLTNVSTGESFSLVDFAGQTVFVEPMATWCTNCRRQLSNVQQARAQLNDENVVFVALSVETNLTDAQLAEYAQSTGFDWVFAVMTAEMLQSMADQFGRTIANPPSTPHFIIRTDGSVAELVTGIEPAEAIIAQIQATQGSQ